MTQISPKLVEYPIDFQNYQNTFKYPNTPYTFKNTNIPLDIQNYQNTSRMINIQVFSFVKLVSQKNKGQKLN